MMIRMISVIAIVVCVQLLTVSALAQKSVDVQKEKGGTVSGKVIDRKTGEPLPGATILLVPPDTTIPTSKWRGAKSMVSGDYIINAVTPGLYTVQVSMVGFETFRIADVEIKSGTSVTVDAPISDKVIKLGMGIKVQGKAESGSVAAADEIRKNATSAQTNMGRDEIGRQSVSNIKDALQSQASVSVMNDELYLLGLTGRYLNLQMNGTALPTNSSDNQTPRVDALGVGMVDMISIQRTATPDQPGSFTAGGINLITRGVPEDRSLSLTGGFSLNELAYGNENFRTYEGSATDVWGFDNGTRELPQYIKDNYHLMPPNTRQARLISADQRRVGDSALKLLTNILEPESNKAPLNRSGSITYGDKLQLFDRPLGYVLNANYNRSFAFYDDGVDRRYFNTLTSTDQTIKSANRYEIAKSKDEVMTSLLGTVVFSIADNHDLNFRYTRNQNAEKVVQISKQGGGSALSDPRERHLVNSLEFEERTLTTYQASGAHQLFLLREAGNSGVKIGWSASTAIGIQDEPDIRKLVRYTFVRDSAIDFDTNGATDTTISVPDTSRLLYGNPTGERYWRFLRESTDQGKADLAIPLTTSISFKTGIDIQRKERDRESYDFYLSGEESINLVGYLTDSGRALPDTLRVPTSQVGQYIDTVYWENDWEKFFEEGGGVVHDSIRVRTTATGFRYDHILGIFYGVGPEGGNAYRATENLDASYAMLDMTPVSDIRVVAGVRLEASNMEVFTKRDNSVIYIYSGEPGQEGGYKSFDANVKLGDLSTNDVLPSINLTWSPTDRMNFRGAYSKTLARPSLREFSPAQSTDFPGGDLTLGNSTLKRTLIDNFDFRWEWFVRSGDLLSVSLYRKNLDNPIEIGFLGTSGVNGSGLVPTNVDKGHVQGVVFEVRKKLDFIAPMVRDLTIGSNVTLSKSEVDLGKLEQQGYRAAGLEPVRPLQGQPDRIVNLDVTYNNRRIGTRATLLLNHVDEQLYINSNFTYLDVYEKEKTFLDFTFSQNLWAGLKLSFSAKNLTDEKIERFYKTPPAVKEVRDLDDVTILDRATYQTYSLGQSYSAGLSWQIW